MPSSRRTVHIPIVQPGHAVSGEDGHEDKLIEVYTQLPGLDTMTRQEASRLQATDSKALDKDWDQVAAPLRKVGLYQAGCVAASAVRKLDIAPPRSALYQRISRLAWIDGQRLLAATAKGPSEGRSAELGLALVLLMGASGSPARQVIATGALGGQPPGVSEDDVEILPVGSLVEKLRLVLTLAGHGSLPRFSRDDELLFFTPQSFDDNGERRDVASLAEVDQLRQMGVRVAPVERLSEAASILNARRSRHLLADRLAQAAVGLVVLLAGAAGAWSMLPAPNIPISFIAGGGLALDNEPYQACFTNDGGFYPIPLAEAGVTRELPGGATLAWRVQIGAGDDQHQGIAGWIDRWRGAERYHVAQIMLSAHSRAKIIIPQSVGGEDVVIEPGGVWEWAWQLIDTAENNALVLLANADQPFDADQLRISLLERFPETAGGDATGRGLDLSAAAQFLATQAPGSVRFTFETVETAERCNS